MASTGIIVTDQGKIIALNRTFKASPDYTAPTKFSVGTGTTTSPGASDTDLENPVTISGGSNTKDIDGGYPVITESTKKVQINCTILTTEANGNSLTEFGLKNTDATKKLFSRAVYTAITKTSSVQVTYTEVDRII